jgi:hypothetical protein
MSLCLLFGLFMTCQSTRIQSSCALIAFMCSFYASVDLMSAHASIENGPITLTCVIFG